MPNKRIEKINDSIFMSNIGVLYDGIMKLAEIIDNKTTNIDKTKKKEQAKASLKETIKAAYGNENEIPRQNVLYSYISFIKGYVTNEEDAIKYTQNMYDLYDSAKSLFNTNLQQMRENLQSVANSAGTLLDAKECYIVYFDEHTQSATEIAWDCQNGKYEDGGNYSDYIGSILQGIHRIESKKKTAENDCFTIKELGWSKNITIKEHASNVRVLSVAEIDAASSENAANEIEEDFLISLKLPIEFNQKIQDGLSVYFIFQIENDINFLNENKKYCYEGWRFRVRSFNTFFNTLVNGLSKNIAYILSEKFFYPRLKNPDNNLINILHISDIHYQTESIEFLITNSANKEIDLLVVTGDLVQATGNADTIAKRYEMCKKALIKLAKRLFKYEWRDRVLIVPGNHDYASMNEVIADNSGRAFSGAKAPGLTDIVNPRVKFAYYLGFVSSFRRDFPNSDKYIDYDINYIDNRFDDWGITFLLLNSSSGVSAHRQNKVALSKSKIELLVNKMEEDKFNICLLHHTPLFNIIYIKDRSSVFAPIQDAYLSLFYDKKSFHLEEKQIKDNIIKIYDILNISEKGKIHENDTWEIIHEQILSYKIKDTIPDKLISYVAKERIIWKLLESLCIKLYDIIDNPEKQSSCKKVILDLINLFENEKNALEGRNLLEKIYERHSEIIGRIAQEKTVADDDTDRYSNLIKNLINEYNINLFMGGHQHVPSFCVSENHKNEAIKYNFDNELFENKKIYISEAGQYINEKSDDNFYNYNLITINKENFSCTCDILTENKRK